MPTGAMQRAAHLLAAATDFEQVLRATLAACMPALADFGFFDVWVGEQVRRTVAAHEDPATEALLKPTQWVRQERTDMNLCALSTGEPGLHPHTDDAWYQRIAANEGHLALLRQLGFGSMITVPMRYGPTLVGALTLFMGRSGRRHGEAELKAVQDIAALAAPVVVNLQLLAAERAARQQAEAAERRMRLLAAASAEMGRSLDVQATLQAIAHLLVPELVDSCRVDLLRPDGTPQVVLLHHADPALAEQLLQHARRWRAPAERPGTVDWVIQQGRPWRGVVTAESMQVITDPQVAELLRRMQVKDSLIVPLVARGRTLGAIATLQAQSGRSFSDEDLLFFSELAQRAALALDNAQLYAQAEAARGEAERANRSKDEFLAMLGHELRNPLAPIVTALALMERRGDPAAREREIIGRQVRHLSRLVDDLLDVSRIAQGRIELQCERLDLSALVTEVVDSVRPALHDSGLACELELPGQALWVHGDPVRLAQVLTNLLVNARKFTPRGGSVRTVLQHEGDHACVQVIDSGVGIAAPLLPQVFDLFTQGPQAPARQQGGLGLGLAIARSLVQLHGGRIAAASEGEGRGSRFSVWLPLLPECAV